MGKILLGVAIVAGVFYGMGYSIFYLQKQAVINHGFTHTIAWATDKGIPTDGLTDNQLFDLYMERSKELKDKAVRRRALLQACINRNSRHGFWETYTPEGVYELCQKGQL